MAPRGLDELLDVLVDLQRGHPGFTLVRRRSITSARMCPPRRMRPISRPT
jgi:hypothetical protein